MLVHPQFDPVAFHVGPLAVRWYGLMYLVGFVLFVVLGKIRARQTLLTGCLRHSARWVLPLDGLVISSTASSGAGRPVSRGRWYSPRSMRCRGTRRSSTSSDSRESFCSCSSGFTREGGDPSARFRDCS